MRRGSLSAIIPVLLLAATTVAAQAGKAGSEPEPEYRGVPLREYVRDLDADRPRTRQLAAEAIGAMGPRAKAAVPALEKMLDSSDVEDRLAAIMALARIGPDAVEAAPKLRKLAKSDPDEAVRQAAAIASDESVDVTVSGWFKSIPTIDLILWGGGLVLFVGVGYATVFAIQRRRPKQPVREAAKPTEKPAAVERQASQPAEASGTMAARRMGRLASAEKDRRSAELERAGRRRTVDEIKRDLLTAQQALDKLKEELRSMARLVEKAKKGADLGQLRTVEAQNDELGVAYYHNEVRLKAFEIKLLEAMLVETPLTDDVLREKSEATLEKKWETLRSMCDNPTCTTFDGNELVDKRLPKREEPIEDYRAFIMQEFDVYLPDRETIAAMLAEERNALAEEARRAADAELAKTARLLAPEGEPESAPMGETSPPAATEADGVADGAVPSADEQEGDRSAGEAAESVKQSAEVLQKEAEVAQASRPLSANSEEAPREGEAVPEVAATVQASTDGCDTGDASPSADAGSGSSGE